MLNAQLLPRPIAHDPDGPAVGRIPRQVAGQARVVHLVLERQLAVVAAPAPVDGFAVAAVYNIQEKLRHQLALILLGFQRCLHRFHRKSRRLRAWDHGREAQEYRRVRYGSMDVRLRGNSLSIRSSYGMVLVL
jgi:hypothetical protein